MKHSFAAQGFKVEDDLRQWVREATRHPLWWIEPAIGSTNGMPDLCVPYDIGQWQIVWIELKVGLSEFQKLKYHVRPQQKVQIREMIANGQVVVMLVGIVGYMDVIAMKCSEDVIEGRVANTNELVKRGEAVWLTSVGRPKQGPSRSGDAVGVGFLSHIFDMVER